MKSSHVARAPRGLRSFTLCALALTLAAAAPAGAQMTKTSVQVSAPAAPAAPAAYDQRATGTAQLLAGITPTPGDPVIDRLAAGVAWKLHAEQMQKDWAKVLPRLAEMEKWRDRELNIKDAAKKTLIYPFSGPDYLNAAVLFPNHKEYVFFSLESPGRLPDVESMTDKQFGKLLEYTRTAMRDIFQRNYFITDYMARQLGTDLFKGTVPVMAIMLALENKRIVSVMPVDMFPELTKQYSEAGGDRPRKKLTGARIAFVDAKTGLQQQITYYSLDATDQALVYYPAFIETIGRNQPATGFLKSASYLLHDHQFKKTRDMLLGTADVIVEDDTGIPYRFFAKSWQVKLYGQYAKPIKPLSYGFQSDLRDAYATQKATPISFPFGYHWKNGKSGLMVATK